MNPKCAQVPPCIIIAACLSFSPAMVRATSILDQTASYNSRLWQTGEDPFRNMVQAIAQTSDGYIWVGTQNGLARFDGEQFEFFPLGEEKNSKSQRVNSLAASGDGDLWVGTAQGLFQWRGGKSVKYKVPEPSHENVLVLRCDLDGAGWVGTGNGLLRCKNEKATLIGREVSPFLGSGSFPHYAVRSMTGAADDGLWISVLDKIVLLKGGAAMRTLDFGAFKPDFIRSICCARDGSIWIGSNNGLLRFKDDKYRQFTKSDGLPVDTVSAVYEDRRGNLWVGTFGGLCRFVNGKFVLETTPEGEPYDQVFCFFEDRENNLWVGAKDGLYQLSVRQFTTYMTRHGLGANNVISVYEDSENALWIGTWDGGLHCLRDGKMTVYSTENTKTLRNNRILAIHGARDGGIWFSEDYGGGLYRLKEGVFKRYAEAEGLDRNAVRAMLEDESGKLWLGRASAYIGVLDQGRVSLMGWREGLPTNATRCLVQGRDGRIWAGTEAGLSVWADGRFTTFTTKNGLSDNTILSLYEDAEKNLWVGTAKGGLNRFRDGKFTVYSSEQGLFYNNVIEILEDDFGNLWMASHHGVYRVNKKELDDLDAGKIEKVSCAAFGKADGMSSQVCVGVAKPSAWKTHDGRLWFATTKGLAVTDPKLQAGKNEKPPPIVIRRAVVDKNVVMEDAAAQVTHHASRITVPPSRGELEFHYNALSYTAPEKNRFKYKLDGLDSDWIDARERRIAYYNNVPPGNYTFRVRAANNDGVWNEKSENVSLTLQPHFWQTMWFRLSLGIGTLSLAAGSARYITKRRMQRKLERLEQQHAIERERARIAKDIHDDLGSSLTRITFLGELAETDKAQPEAVSGHVQKIVNAARDTVRSLDEIVWAVNPRYDTLDSLMEYIAQFVHEFFENTPVRCRLDLPDEVPPVPLSSEARHSLFLVVKEALNNVLKHAGATMVSVHASFVKGEFSIRIIDDGRGFALKEALSGRLSNGLGNMRKRIEDLGGFFDIESAPGGGTKLTVTLPLINDSNGAPSHVDANTPNASSSIK